MSLSYNRTNPFLASIKERFLLCGPGSKKNTQHIVLNLAGSGITYQVGDSIGILPHNDPHLVAQTLKAIKATGEEPVTDRQGATYSLRNFLTYKANLTEINRKLLNELLNRQPHPEKRRHLEILHQDDQHDQFKSYQEMHHVWDLLLAHEEVSFQHQEFCQLLMPLLPRLYSIASSHKMVPEEIHLTIAMLTYSSNGHQRRGVCTHYLDHLTPIGQAIVPIYIQPHHGFTLPSEQDANIIMIGPGTGVAPFRAFMQERMMNRSSGKNWLFFGEWNRTTDFFYESFWKDLEAQNKLRLDLAFSRDQDHKVYVQHRMLEQGEELFRWIERGAYLFVCGDAKRMAKDVENTLLDIIQTHGKMDEQGAKQYLKSLRAEKRYLRDVY